MRPRWLASATLSVVLGLAMTACARPDRVQAGARPEGPASAQRAAIDWADAYCQAVGGLVQTLSTMPSIDPGTPEAASRTSADLLGSVVGGLDRTLAGLSALPPAPVDGGEKVRSDAVRTFSGIHDRAAAAKDHLVQAGGAAGSDKALGDARAILDDIAKLDLLQGMTSVPGLADAAGQASSCRTLVPSELGTTGPQPHP